MTDDRSTQGTVTEELRQLGRNLTQVLNAAWESPERKAIQAEFANALNQLGDVLKEEAHKFKDSPAGQRVKESTQDVRERIRSRDEELREDLVNALRGANTRLQQTAERMGQKNAPDSGAGAGPAEARAGAESSSQAPQPQVWTAEPHETGRQEIHPDDVDSAPKETGHQEIHPDDVES